MASKLYQRGFKLVMDGDLDIVAVTMNVIFTRTSAHTFSQTHDFFDDLVSPVGESSGTNYTDGGQLLSDAVDTASAYDAADTVMTAVASGAALDSLHIYRELTSNALSPLLVYVDGFSITPNGGDITIQWAATPNFIFKLAQD